MPSGGRVGLCTSTREHSYLLNPVCVDTNHVNTVAVWAINAPSSWFLALG